MRLAELDPKWLVFEGRRVGFVFRCPLWDRDPKYQWWQTCFFQSGFKLLTCPNPECYQDPDLWCCPHSQMGLVEAAGVDVNRAQACNRECAWTQNGVPIELATWDDLNIIPSLDGSAGGLWHGYITNGQIVGGL